MEAEHKTVEVMFGRITNGMTTKELLQLIHEVHDKAQQEKLWDIHVDIEEDYGSTSRYVRLYGTRYENADERRDREREEERQRALNKAIRLSEYEKLKQEFGN